MPLALFQVASAGGTRLGEPNPIAMGFFFAFIAVTLGITYWAARRTRTTEEFYAAGRTVSAGQNGFALAGDYMSAASFLGIAGLVSTTGFDGLIYSTGWLVGWPVVWETLLGGQSSLFTLAILCTTVALIDARRFTAAGAVLAIATFKPNVLAWFVLGYVCWIFWKAKKRDEAEERRRRAWRNAHSS